MNRALRQVLCAHATGTRHRQPAELGSAGERGEEETATLTICAARGGDDRSEGRTGRGIAGACFSSPRLCELLGGGGGEREVAQAVVVFVRGSRVE
jgi:hypothetical protein